MPVPTTAVLLPPLLHLRLVAAARAAWPHELAALLGGQRHGDTVAVQTFAPLPATGRADRFAADAVAFADAEAALRAAGAAFVGFCHSHPHAAPHPSRRDLVTAWPGCVQLLLGGAAADDLHGKAFTIQHGVATPVPLVLGTPGEVVR